MNTSINNISQGDDEEVVSQEGGAPGSSCSSPVQGAATGWKTDAQLMGHVLDTFPLTNRHNYVFLW